jgi:hypothetical protein
LPAVAIAQSEFPSEQTPLHPSFEFMEHRGVVYAVVQDVRHGLWRWSVLVGRPEMLRIGDAESEHQADLQVRAVIDRALALDEMLRKTSN